MATLGLRLQTAADAPLYQQLFDQVSERVKSGAWPAGFRLPPTRALADELGTHRNTVVRAYQELVASGYLDSTVGRGTFVSERPRARSAAASSASAVELPWRSLLSGAASAPPLVRLARYRKDPTPPGAVDLGRMEPSLDLLPAADMRRSMDHVMRTLGARALGYGPREGVPVLKESIARLLADAGVPVRAEDILITTGSQQALDLLARALVEKGDRFLVDGATYTGALNLLTVAGAQVVGVPWDEHGPDMAWLRRLARGEVKGLYLMPNGHNPTGRTIALERRRELVEWSHEAGVPLIEDDYVADLSVDGTAPPASLRALDPEVVYLSTFSKKLMPALRIGFVAAPRALRDALAVLKHATDLGNSALMQHALAEFLDRGYLRAHYQRVLPVYRERRDALDAALKRHLPSAITWELPARGVVMWLALPPEMDPDDVYDAARRAGVIVAPGTLNGVAGRGAAGVRVNYCFEPAERLVEGAKRLGKAIKELMRRTRRRTGALAPAIQGV